MDVAKAGFLMTLVEHAQRELELTGWFKDDPHSAEAMLGAVREFAKGGWSGGSAPFGVHIVSQLLEYKPLSPLTADPAEWNHISEAMAGQPDLWQSQRRPDAFSNDGGKTYYLLDELPVRYDRDPRWLWMRYKRPKIGFTRGSDKSKLKRYTSDVC